MSDPGLSRRLSQRSRRAGLMIGISMIVTIAFCAVAFTVIYTALDGFTTDFVSGTDRTPTAVEEVAVEQGSLPTAAPADANQDAEPPATEAAPNSEETLPTPTPEPDSTPADEDGFTPDYQTQDGSSINLREGPSTATSILDTLPPATPLQYLNEETSTDGAQWMRFRTEDGLEGWMRRVDVNDYEP